MLSSSLNLKTLPLEVLVLVLVLLVESIGVSFQLSHRDNPLHLWVLFVKSPLRMRVEQTINPYV